MVGHNFLIIGGAGYIGSHVVKALLEKGNDVVILDNLSKGHCEAMTGGDARTPDRQIHPLFDSRCLWRASASPYIRN